MQHISAKVSITKGQHTWPRLFDRIMTLQLFQLPSNLQGPWRPSNSCKPCS